MVQFTLELEKFEYERNPTRPSRPLLSIVDHMREYAAANIPERPCLLLHSSRQAANAVPRVKLRLASGAVDTVHLDRKAQDLTLDWDYVANARFEAFDVPLFYDHQLVRDVRRIAINALHGFDSDATVWDRDTNALILKNEYTQTPFCRYWTLAAEIGTIRRRVLNIQSHIGVGASAASNFGLRAALSAFIETEIQSVDIALSELELTRRLIDFRQKVDEVSNLLHEVHTILQRIGLTAENSGATDSRLPGSARILEAVYALAKQQTHTERLGEPNQIPRMLLFNNVLYPWIQQLNFVIGLCDPLIPRVLRNSIKARYFPDIFIAFKNHECVLINDQIPAFLPRSLAQATAQCYTLTCLLHVANLPRALQREGTKPIDWRLVNTSGAILAPLSESPSKKPKLLSLQSRHKVETAQPRHLLCRLMTVAKREHELDLLVKNAIMNQLCSFRDVVVNLFMLKDGRLWSHMCEYIQDAFSIDEYTAAAALVKLEAIVNLEFKDICFVHDKTSDELLVQYEPPALIIQLFGISFVTNHCQRIFSSMISLYRRHKVQELSRVEASIDDVKLRIDAALNNPGVGVRALVKVFKTPVHIDLGRSEP